MAGSIFVLHDNGGLVEAKEEPYESEDLLQRLLAEYPNLLAGDQMNPNSPRRWALVSREMSVPDNDEANGRWSLDHLFLDQEAIPTLVEVKRSTDSRIRREVIGQMLDYAANAVAYWPVEQLQSAFERTCKESGRDVEAELSALVEDQTSIEEFWLRVKTNIQAGRIRLVFVADIIPSELRRVIEFLNTQMDPAEVLGVEVRQFVGDGLRSLVPRVLGQTEAAIKSKRLKGSSSVRQSISEEDWMAGVAAFLDPERMQIARAVVKLARGNGLQDLFERKDDRFTFRPLSRHDAEINLCIELFVGEKDAYIRIDFTKLRKKPPFNAPEMIEELGRRLSPMFDPAWTPNLSGTDTIKLQRVVERGLWESLSGVLDFIIKTLNSAN